MPVVWWSPHSQACLYFNEQIRMSKSPLLSPRLLLLSDSWICCRLILLFFFHLNFNLLSFMCVGVLPACMYLHSWCMQRSEEGTGFPAAEVTDGYEPRYGCEELNPRPLDGYLVVNCWTISPAPAYSSPYNRVCISISQSKFSPAKNTLPTSSQPFTHFQKF